MKKPLIIYADFQKLDLLVGEVISAELVKESKKLIMMSVDLGVDYGTVEIMAGIAGYYQPEDLVGKKFAFVANLEPKKMIDRFSNGMTLMADIDGKPIILPLPNEIPNGTLIC